MYNKTISKEEIVRLKEGDNEDLSLYLKAHSNNSADIIYILENIGQLPKSVNVDLLISLTKYENEMVRFWAVKNIGKLKSDENLQVLYTIAKNDESTLVRREAVSSIGRQRSRKGIFLLKDILKDNDPKIVCQAIRGLLVFKGDEDIDNTLKKMINHENETVSSFIKKEYFTPKKTINSTLPHQSSYPFMRNVIVKGDVRDVLKYVPDDSIHLTFTSPPYYNARDYSIYASYDAYMKFLEEVFSMIYRITKEGRFLIVNTSPVIVPRVSRQHSSKRYPIPFDLHYYLVKMGWEFIDDIIWEKPEYSVKNRIGGFQQHRKPLAYKPNNITEYVMVYRKKSERLLDWNIHQYDTQTVEESKVQDGFETTNVWKINPKSDKVHSAIFPIELCRKVIEYYSYKGDLVFDPFAGSGTLGRTAQIIGRNFFMTEKEEKYFDYMKKILSDDMITKVSNTKFLTLEQFKATVL